MNARVYYCQKPGFSLPEVLIALALLGVIAAFTIPKVLHSTPGGPEKKRMLIETVSTLESAWNSLELNDQLQAGTAQENLVRVLNTVSVSPDVVSSSPGPLTGVGHPCNTNGYTGMFLLPSGVLIMGLNWYPYTQDQLHRPQSMMSSMMCIDINAEDRPNTVGEDVFYALLNPWGDCDVGGSTYTPRAAGKRFCWGSETEPLYAPNGTNLSFDTPTGRVGYWLTR